MYIAETHSTNTLLRQMWQEGQAVDVLWTDYQTAGRGQAGNGWESAAGENILLSVAAERLPIRIEQQWRVSMLFALAVVEALCEDKRVEQEAVTIKWPNDIYYHDRKLAGILIEHTLDSEGIALTIIGIGLNVNQLRWEGNAPNPTSLRRETGAVWDRDALRARIVARWQESLPRLQDEARLHTDYMAHLYRREGWYMYMEREVSTEPTMIVQSAKGKVQSAFSARIVDVTPQGELVLETPEGEQRTYHFKQIRYVI